MANKITLGEVVTSARRRKEFDQKTLAGKIKREDGASISPQYLNDIEHNRRSPSGLHLIKQVAKVLDVDPEYLTYVATGVIPEVAELVPADSEEEYKATVDLIVEHIKGAKSKAGKPKTPTRRS
jgi:transcriptional regulator with XRE-family HTH domain